MVNPIRSIKAYNAGREPERLAIKYKAMRQDAFVFLRGTCHLYYERFYERLPQIKGAGVLKRAPLTWVCGDLHLQNFGSYKGDNRLVYFDINDFDEGALAPCTWDLVRFLSSVLVGGKTLGAKPAQTLSLCNTFLDAYTQALMSGKARWVERETAEGLVRELLTGLQMRKRHELLDRRTEIKKGKRRIHLDGKHALPIAKKRRAQISAFMSDYARTQPDRSFYQVLDVANRVAGTGSLGIERYIILVEGKGSPEGNYLLDLKEAIGSSLISHLKVRQLRTSGKAHQVVAIQRRMQAISMAFLQPVVIGKKSYVMRGLQPTEDRVALDHWNGKLDRLEGVLNVMGKIVAWAQLRSGGRDGSATIDELIAFGREDQWRKRLLAMARACAEQVEADWQVFVEAFDAGEFND